YHVSEWEFYIDPGPQKQLHCGTAVNRTALRLSTYEVLRRMRCCTREGKFDNGVLLQCSAHEMEPGVLYYSNSTESSMTTTEYVFSDRQEGTVLPTTHGRHYY